MGHRLDDCIEGRCNENFIVDVEFTAFDIEDCKVLTGGEYLVEW